MITITKILEQVYVLKDRANCYANLVIGEEKALLFDTGCGVDDMAEAVRTVTDLPLITLASHGHFDHIGGSYQFEKVYLASSDREILESSKEWKNIDSLNFDHFSLGTLDCQIISLKGHTKGSVGVYIPSFRLLLSGDALTPIMCLNFQNHLSKEVQYETLKTVQNLQFDYYLTSHHEVLFPKSIIGRMIRCIKNSKDKKHYAYQYPYPPYTKGWIYLDSMEEEPVGLVVEEI